MKRFKYLASIFLGLISLASCTNKEYEFSNTPKGNFEACWQIVNERYCFFEYKHKEYGLDWDQVYLDYKGKISNDMTQDSLFTVLNQMLQELHDGHVNIYSSFDIGRYWNWFTDFPANFDSNIQRNYIGWDYRIAGGLTYKMLPDSVGYVYYGSFSSGVSEANLNEVLKHFKQAKGLILDIRNNGGGTLTNVDKIAARFTNEPFRAGYIQYKSGTGRYDFSKPFPFDQIACPTGQEMWDKEVVVLTNRHVYSAANQFINVMKDRPRVTIMGDKTGGGSGLPFNSLLPIGWSIRFSSSPILNKNQEHTEFGIDPNVKVDMTEEDMDEGEDTIIEAAIARILANA